MYVYFQILFQYDRQFKIKYIDGEYVYPVLENKKYGISGTPTNLITENCL